MKEGNKKANSINRNKENGRKVNTGLCKVQKNTQNNHYRINWSNTILSAL